MPSMTAYPALVDNTVKVMVTVLRRATAQKAGTVVEGQIVLILQCTEESANQDTIVQKVAN